MRRWRAVDAGALMSYGATTSEIYTTAAEQVAKILDGARPSELPLRQATRFELVINNKTAKGLGLTIPASLLERARQGDRIGAMSAFGTSRHRQVHRKCLLSGVKRSRICFHAARGTSMAAQY